LTCERKKRIMLIRERFTVPTGDILVVRGDYGVLEMLSLGDYGKAVNVKCDAMGLSRTPEPVRHTALLPLEKKWVVTISTQYGCSMGCRFCDVPRVGPGRNATHADLVGQVQTALKLHQEVSYTDRLNIHFARMGEPTWNAVVPDAARWLGDHLDPAFCTHPVVSTMMPKGNDRLHHFLWHWMNLKNNIRSGDAGLQLSINSTEDSERHEMFGGSALSLKEIAELMATIPSPVGRKITLNFAVANYTIDPDVLRGYFDPENYLVKLTPMHRTRRATAAGLQTEGDYTTYTPYQQHEEALKAVGYDVLVFIASREEDEGRITCGNAILSGTRPFQR
jgi:23S rRNA (adenine2503-C2)-methyltransferase